ncbi:FHA domain-containing protein [Pseudolysinimonas sp.]|uniref:FHA domain-containing protein n=1 Tax=Pseudolysinimonas sp. TaxID=2680009 RepID=UPI003783C583
MEPDLDDTRLSVPRTPLLVPTVDLDDTVVRGPAPADVAPPALVEPPAPEARQLPLFVEPELPVADDEGAAPAPTRAEFRAVLADGTEVPIDVPVYLGRNPSIPRIHTGPAPRLVTLASPTREMSATHLELRLLGGSLVASDMRSTNGTIVQLPGAAPRTLIRGESAVIVAGTRIDLGEGAVIDILAPRASDAE